jgi:hypothetical protein
MLDVPHTPAFADQEAHLRDDPVPHSCAPIIPSIQREANDNHTNIGRVGERQTFELPRVIWQGMIACYAVFLTALLASIGGGRAGFAIAVSAVYVAMFFGTARVISRQSPPQKTSPLERSGAVLETAFGPLSRSAVFGQILIVPVAVALFGLAIAVVIAVVM